MSQVSHIEKVAIVGATGRIGKHFAEALLKTGKHTVTALTRADSKGTLPAGVETVQIDYEDEDSIVSALKGQQFFIITLAVSAPPGTQSKLVKAADKAGVQYIMPNIYGFDITNKSLGEGNLHGASYKITDEIVAMNDKSYIVMTCGFWYEWSLALGEQWFGFDIKNRKVTFFDDGNTKINTSTWMQCGRALAALLSFSESGASPAVSDWKNKAVYISSFRVCQRDMLDSLHRVLGTSDKDWEIKNEPSGQRYKDGLEELQKGIRTGFAKAMYSRTFYPNGDGDFESSKGLNNDVLGLPREDLDISTRAAVEMVESGWNPFAQ